MEKPGNIQEPKDGEHGRMVAQCIDMRFTKGHGVEFSKENIPDEITLLFYLVLINKLGYICYL